MTTLGYGHDSIENEYEEVAQTALRHKLGVRPTWYVDGQHASPDTGVCPAWCYHATDSEAPLHETEPAHPMTVTHNVSYSPETVASLYPGQRHHDETPWVTHTATLRTSLRQRGQQAPEIYINLIQPDGPPVDERLNLTPADARDLIKALTYLADLAEVQ